MPLTYYRLIRGRAVVAGKMPDGDSVRFIPDAKWPWEGLTYERRIQPSFEDGSVQLRLEGIDAPEVHYGPHAQPFGAEARDVFLQLLGFDGVRFNPGKQNQVIGSNPESVRVAILTRAADANGRIVSYLMNEQTAGDYADGEVLRLGEEALMTTLNSRMLEDGLAYYMGYTSTPLLHRTVFIKAAKRAREAKLGVWALDQSREFYLDGQADITQDGQLIFPKLFRRCTEFLIALRGGFRGGFADWLISTETGRGRIENDRVVIQDRFETRLSELVMERNRKIALQVDLLDCTFVEH